MDPNTKLPFWGYHAYGKLYRIDRVEKTKFRGKDVKTYYIGIEIKCSKYLDDGESPIRTFDENDNAGFGEQVIEELKDPSEILEKSKRGCIYNIFHDNSLKK